MMSTTCIRPAQTADPCTDPSSDDAPAVTLQVEAVTEPVPPTSRMIEIALRFGICPHQGQRFNQRVKLNLQPGRVTLLTGPSGAGKTMLLEAIARQFPAAIDVNRMLFPNDVAVIDAVAPTRPAAVAMRLLTASGLGEPRLWLRPFDALSEGERFRARLARAVSLIQRRRQGLLMCDEFGAVLHRRLAEAIACNLSRLVRRERIGLVLACPHTDLERALQADQIVRLGQEPVIVEQQTAIESPPHRCPLIQRLRIMPGSVRDYQALAGMHYRANGRIGFVDKVFLCREGDGGDVLGVVVYARPVLELAPRNRVTGGRFSKQPERLNEELRLLKRIVIHPDVRGCGIGHWLVRQTLPQVGTRFVECLAAMGAVHPIFEKAGMIRVGTCRPPVERARVLGQMRAAGVNPWNGDFVSQVCRRPIIRKLAAGEVARWYRATTSNPDRRMHRLSPTALAWTFRQIAGSEPVYYLWSADKAGWEMIHRGMEPMR